MGIWDSICSVASSVFSAATKVISTATEIIGKVLTTTANDYLKIAKVAIETFRMVSDVLEYIGKRLGIIDEKDNTEDLGDRALRAKKTESEFGSSREFIDYLKTEVEPISEEELNKLSTAERLGRKSIGNALLSKAISETTSLEIPVEFWKLAVDAGLSVKEIDTFLQKFKELGIKPVEFVKYLKMELNEQEEPKVEDKLILAYKEIEPNLDKEDIKEKLLEQKVYE